MGKSQADEFAVICRLSSYKHKVVDVKSGFVVDCEKRNFSISCSKQGSH